MFKRLIAGALVFGLAATAPPVAAAQSACATRARVTEKLHTVFDESLSAAGLQSATSVIEVWSSEKSGSWTIISSRADGISCVLASGTNWYQVGLKPKMRGAKANFPASVIGSGLR